MEEQRPAVSGAKRAQGSIDQEVFVMVINALLLDPKDNVVTCVADVAAGSEVVYRRGDETVRLTAEEAIPYCHKIALCDLAEEEAVIKYGEMIGKTNRRIAKGCLVDHTNIYSIPRDYDSEMI